MYVYFNELVSPPWWLLHRLYFWIKCSFITCDCCFVFVFFCFGPRVSYFYIILSIDHNLRDDIESNMLNWSKINQKTINLQSIQFLCSRDNWSKSILLKYQISNILWIIREYFHFGIVSYKPFFTKNSIYWKIFHGLVLYENPTSTCVIIIHPSCTTCKRVFLNEATHAYQHRYVYNTNRRSHV